MLGYTINLLTLFALVLAIGIVVDDAIVIVEGVTQHIERGMAPKEASIQTMKELLGPILGITYIMVFIQQDLCFRINWCNVCPICFSDCNNRIYQRD